MEKQLSIPLLLVLLGTAGSQTASDAANPGSPVEPAEEDASAYLCRSRGRFLSIKAFELETCAMCYKYMPGNQFVEEGKWNLTWFPKYEVEGFRVPRLLDTNGSDVVKIVVLFPMVYSANIQRQTCVLAISKT